MIGRLRDYLSMIKISHTVFALPFALIAFLFASRGGVDPATLGWVIVCIVAARAAAMAYNRFADRALDADNPRTAAREIPAGLISAAGALAFTVFAAAVFLAAALMLGPACFYGAIPVLVVLLGYSHAKRFTVLAHLWLGVALGLAPPAAWVAARGVVDATLLAPVALGAGVSLWVAGFDILYACQDEAFDAARGLHSIPARYGRARALRISALLHVLCVPFFLWFGVQTGAGTAYFVGVGIVALVLFGEHRVLSPSDISRVDTAFFTMNGLVSLVMLSCAAIDIYLVG